jgi:hypothetical protein
LALTGAAQHNVRHLERGHVNIFELADTLPNGLHDAEILDFAISYEKQVVRARAQVWVGSVEALPDRREQYRPAVLELYQVEYCIFDRPHPEYPYKSAPALTVDLVPPDPAVMLPGEGTPFRFWVGEWNAFIHVRAGDATLTWQGPAECRPNA